MTGKMPTPPRYYDPARMDWEIEQMRQAQRDAAMNSQRLGQDLGALNSWGYTPIKKYKTNAIGIPLIKYNGEPL